MKHLMATYKVKKEKIPEVLESIEDFIASAKKESGIIRYDSFRVTSTDFVHFMTFKDEKSEKKHKESDHTKKFVKSLYPNCRMEPIFTELKEITE